MGTSRGRQNKHTATAVTSKGPARILVAGAGAVGSVFGCLLAEAGEDVTLFGRPRLMEAVAARGLRVEGIWGQHGSSALAVAVTAEELRPPYDAVLICCKAYQTAGILEDLGDCASPTGLAISLQNGLGNFEQLQSVYGRDRVMLGRVIFGAQLLDPGRVKVTVEAEPVLIGAPREGAGEQALRWASVFDRAGIHCRATDSIMGSIWAKVFYNAALNPLGALLGLNYGELADDPCLRSCMVEIIEEAWDVAVAEGVELEWDSSDRYVEHFFSRLVPSTAGHRSSMLQDMERNRPTEIEAICGEICRRGDAHGLGVSANRLLLGLVRARSGK